MKRKYALPLVVLAAVLGIGFVWPSINFYMMTRRWSPIQRIETLQNPVPVTGWNSNGLVLANGRIVQIPGIRALPNTSPALVEGTKRGIEIGTNGRVFGLVRVHHWCGNDPVREHIAKVDLSDMMLYLRVGEPSGPVHEAELLAQERDGSFTQYGWRVGEFSSFQSWQSGKNSTP